MLDILLAPIQIENHDFRIRFIYNYSRSYLVAALAVFTLALLMFISIGLLTKFKQFKQSTVKSVDFFFLSLMKLILIVQLGFFRSYIQNFSASNILHKIVFIKICLYFVPAVLTNYLLSQIAMYSFVYGARAWTQVILS